MTLEISPEFTYLPTQSPRPFGYIYLITNSVNGKYYVGQTCRTIAYRWSVHKSDAKLRSSGYLHKAIRKYGPETFIVEAVASAMSLEQLNKLETAWILVTRAYDSSVGYNRTFGGDSNIPTAESCKKMAESARLRVLTAEERNKISIAMTGRRFTEEHRSKISLANKGKKPSLLTRQRVAEANRNRVHSDETRAKLRSASHKSLAKRGLMPRCPA